ncbi:MAG TPA: glutamate synthase subunit alpha, partial [bacterium]|nr:glutamate synthase subunit alpha [bacterium]
MKTITAPGKQGLYDPKYEHDACGVGFVANLKGRKSHEIIRQGLDVLMNLRHRGACGCEVNTGDGAGILLQVPHAFLEKETKKAGFALPAAGTYGVGMVFLPRGEKDRKRCEAKFEEIVKAEGQGVIGWRTVPTVNDSLGETAKFSEPAVRQVFIAAGKGTARRAPTDALDFERKLYVIRKRAENAIRFGMNGGASFYVASLSSRTIVYKGMLNTEQVELFFPELNDPSMETGLALAHSRFSTNTFPSWERAHPYRYIAHNGEINTVQGNRNWMRTRESLLESNLLPGLDRAFPICTPGASDSASFDEVLELLHLGGRSLPHAVLMMIPEAWENHETMDAAKRSFYRFHASLMEPWDGPASVAFTDGTLIGAVLDRNGLRPSRYWVTDDGLVLMASEVGVLDIDPA